MFSELDPKHRPDAEAGEDELEFEKLEFLPEEDESEARAAGGGSDLTFEATSPAEPPVTVDPQGAPPDLPDSPVPGGDPDAGTPFELLGSSLFDRFGPDDSLDWAFDFDDSEIDDLDS